MYYLFNFRGYCLLKLVEIIKMKVIYYIIIIGFFGYLVDDIGKSVEV